MKRRSCYRSQVWWGWALSIRRSPWKPWKLDLLEKEKKEKKKKKWGLATLLLLMNVHIVTMYVSWFVVHCDKCMVNIALQHCKSYLLNLICRCVCVCVCVRACVYEMAKKTTTKKKKQQNETLLKHFTTGISLNLRDSWSLLQHSICHWLELKMNVILNHFNGNKTLPQHVWRGHGRIQITVHNTTHNVCDTVGNILFYESYLALCKKLLSAALQKLSIVQGQFLFLSFFFYYFRIQWMPSQ